LAIAQELARAGHQLLPSRNPARDFLNRHFAESILGPVRGYEKGCSAENVGFAGNRRAILRFRRSRNGNLLRRSPLVTTTALIIINPELPPHPSVPTSAYGRLDVALPSSV